MIPERIVPLDPGTSDRQEEADTTSTPTSSSWQRTRGWLRRHIYELSLHQQRLIQPRQRPVVVIFPSNQPWDAASNLRAWLIGPELTRLGWRVITVPEPLSLRQRRRVLWLERPDVILLQQTRNLLNQPQLYPEYPCVLDADDADYLDPRHQARIARCATAARVVVGGNRFVANCLRQHNPNAHVLWTGSPRPERPPATPPEERPPLVTWAHATPFGYPHESRFIQDVLLELAGRRSFEFWLFGTDENEAAEWFSPLRARGVRCTAVARLPYPEYLNKVACAAVGLQPVATQNEFSAGKSFGKLLAYLSGQVPVVASNAVDHALFFRDGETGLLPEDSVPAWADAIEGLLADPKRRGAMARAAYDDFLERLTTDAFARRLDPILREAMRLAPTNRHRGSR